MWRGKDCQMQGSFYLFYLVSLSVLLLYFSISNRYVIIKKLGWGHFSTVWMVKDRNFVSKPKASTADLIDQFLAIKVQKSAEHYTEAAMDEVELLDCVVAERKRCEAQLDANFGAKDSDKIPVVTNVSHSQRIATLADSFFHNGPNGRHMCMAFRMLGCNLLSVIKAYNYRGIPIPVVKNMIRDIAQGLDFLHRKCEIIHTDLKPENVLLEFPSELKLAAADNLSAASGLDFEAIEGQNVPAEANKQSEEVTIEELEAAIQNPNTSAEERKRLKKKLKKRRQKQKRVADNEDDDGGDDGSAAAEDADLSAPIHINPSALALAKMTLSDHEMERVLKDLPAYQNGNLDAGPTSHQRVLSRLSHSPFIAKNFSAVESPSVVKAKEVFDETVSVSCPPKAQLNKYLEMCNHHLSGDGIAEVAFVVRSYTSEGELADCITAALGGIPWTGAAGSGDCREWVCQLSIPGKSGDRSSTCFSLKQTPRKTMDDDHREALSELHGLIEGNLASANPGSESDKSDSGSESDKISSPPFSTFSVQFSVLSTSVVLGFLESCLPGVMFFSYGQYDGEPDLDPVVFGDRANDLCKHSLAMSTLDKPATSLFGFDLRIINDFAAQPTAGGDGAASFDLTDSSMVKVASWWNARQTIQYRVNNFVGLDSRAEASELPILSGNGFTEGGRPSGDAVSSNKESADKANGSAPTSLTAMQQAIACASYQPDLKDANNLEKARAVVVDLGNACWTHRHFSEDIQTRQYRAPEVLFGSKYDTSADIWSLGCMTFELLTGDLLFDPRASEEYDRDEDHLAMFQELLGKIPKKLALSGKYSKKFFDKKGNLRNIKQLKFWPIEEVLHEKYHFSREDAEDISNFMLPLLEFDPKERATAFEVLKSDWLKTKKVKKGKK